MLWIAPSEKDPASAALEKPLWDAADQFRANSGLKSQEYSAPVLGLIFLRFAEVRFAAHRAKLEKTSASARRGSRVDDPAAHHAEGILSLPAQIGVLANLVRLYRGEPLDFTLGGNEARAKLEEIFGTTPPGGTSSASPQPSGGTSSASPQPSGGTSSASPQSSGGTSSASPQPSGGTSSASPQSSSPTSRDVPGLCRAATLPDIEAQGWSLNPGRYVGVAPGEAVSDEDFKEQLEKLNEELETLNAAARTLEATIANNVSEILEV